MTTIGSLSLARPVARSRTPWRIIGVVVSLLVVAGPAIVSDPYYSRIIVQIAIFGMLALALNLLFGFAGQISIGQAAFYGLGAYTSGVLQTKLMMSWPLAWIIAIGGTIMFAWLLSFPILRLRGHYLALGTLAFGLIVQTLLSQLVPITGGPSGIVIPAFTTLGPWMAEQMPFIVMVAFVLVYWGVRNLTHFSAGRAFTALRDDPDGAGALGIPVSRYKGWAFVISAGISALAGVLYANWAGVITPETFSVTFSIEILLMVVIGGLGSTLGSVAGAAVVVILPIAFQGVQEYQYLIYSIVVLALLFFEPRGLAGIVRQIVRRLRRPQGGNS